MSFERVNDRAIGKTLNTPGSRQPGWLKGVIIYCTGVVAFLLAWKLLAESFGMEILLPPPESAFARLFELLPNREFWLTIRATILRAIYGFTLSFLAGLAVGLAAGTHPGFNRFISPILSVLRATPVMSVILLGMLWFVTDLVPVFVTFLMVFPLICANTLEGVVQIDRKLLEMGRLYGLSRLQRLLHILLPSLFPYLIAAANAGFGMAWRVTIAAEVLSQPREAIGTGIRFAQINLEIPEVMAWTVAAVLLSMLTEKLLSTLVGAIPWRRVRG